MTAITPPLPPLDPFRYTATADGWQLTRPDTRGDKLLRRVQRFLSICLVGLAAGLVWMATLMTTPGDTVVAALFALICIAGALIVGWWMSILGARRIERRADGVHIRTIRFAGVEKTHHIAPGTALNLRATGHVVRGRGRPVRGWKLTLETPERALPLGFVPAPPSNATAAPTALAELLSAELQFVDPP